MDEYLVHKPGKFESNSRECVALINEYWEKRGYFMQARVELKKVSFKDKHGRTYSYYHEEIASDSVRGIPLHKIGAVE